MAVLGLFALLVAGLGNADSAHTMVADAPAAGRERSADARHPAERLLNLLVDVTSSAEALPQEGAPIPMDAPESGLGSVEADDELNDLDDFAYHLRVVFDGTAQLNRIVEPGMSLGGRALSRLEDNRNHKPPRS